MFLRVGVTKYCKLQGKMLPGRATGSTYLSRALSNTVRTPSASTVWGKILQKVSQGQKMLENGLAFCVPPKTPQVCFPQPNYCLGQKKLRFIGTIPIYENVPLIQFLP